MRGRFPGYDTDVTPSVFVVCSVCGDRVDRANILMVKNDDGTYRCWKERAS